MGFHGSGIISYREALSAVFLEGFVAIFILAFVLTIEQLDFLHPLDIRSPTMVGSHYAPVLGSRGRRWNWSFHCVSARHLQACRSDTNALADSSACVSLDLSGALFLFTYYKPASGGLGVIGGDPVNFVGLGGCLPQDMLDGFPGFCTHGVLRSPTMWLGVFLGGCVLTYFRS